MPQKWWQYWFLQTLAGLFSKTLARISKMASGCIFFRLQAEGLEHLPQEGPIVMTPTHKSYFDQFFIFAALPLASRLIPVRYMAANKLFHIPFWKFGFVLRYALEWGGALRALPKSGLRSPLRVLQDQNAGRRVVTIYPEGGLNYGFGVRDIGIGAAYLGKKSGAKMLPVAICGIEDLTLKDFLFGRRSVTVKFGEPFLISPEEDINLATKRVKLEMERIYWQN